MLEFTDSLWGEAPWCWDMGLGIWEWKGTLTPEFSPKQSSKKLALSQRSWMQKQRALRGRMGMEGTAGRQSERSGKKWRQEAMQMIGFLSLFPPKIS